MQDESEKKASYTNMLLMCFWLLFVIREKIEQWRDLSGLYSIIFLKKVQGCQSSALNASQNSVISRPYFLLLSPTSPSSSSFGWMDENFIRCFFPVFFLSASERWRGVNFFPIENEKIRLPVTGHQVMTKWTRTAVTIDWKPRFFRRQSRILFIKKKVEKRGKCCCCYLIE